MNAIVCADREFAIGKDGGMLFHLPEDLKYFSRMTRGKTLVMGRATLASFPGGRPLKDRRNIVFSRNPDYVLEGAAVVHSYRELDHAIAGLPQDEVMLLGGESLYRSLIDCCEKAYVTRVQAAAPADRWFPNLDQKSNWRLDRCSEELEQNGLRFQYCEYVNLAVKPLSDLYKDHQTNE